MNHRIKNNLSLVGAMLALQARRFTDAAMREELGKAVSRINNLSLVHDRLQAFATGASRMDAAAHFQQLCDMLRSLVPAGATLSARCSGTLPGDCVESLTLIANELVTNAAKYAFGGRERGEIILGYREEGAGWRLWVEDDGVGLPADHEERSKNSFGRMLIATLASRVNADVIYRGSKGTRVDVCCGVSP
jgi:two-component sensor histidine kinase